MSKFTPRVQAGLRSEINLVIALGDSYIKVDVVPNAKAAECKLCRFFTVLRFIKSLSDGDQSSS